MQLFAAQYIHTQCGVQRTRGPYEGKIDGKSRQWQENKHEEGKRMAQFNIPVLHYSYSSIPVFHYSHSTESHLTMVWNGAFLLPSFPDLIDLFQEDKANMHAVAGKISFGTIRS